MVERLAIQAVLKTIIPRNADLRDAHFHRQDIFTYAPFSKSALAYQRSLIELFHQPPSPLCLRAPISK